MNTPKTPPFGTFFIDVDNQLITELQTNYNPKTKESKFMCNGILYEIHIPPNFKYGYLDRTKTWIENFKRTPFLFFYHVKDEPFWLLNLQNWKI